MAESLESGSLESMTVLVDRTSTTVKGGRRLGFVALVVVGDRNGQVGLGYGKARGVPAAIEKAQKDAKRNLTKVIRKEGTLPHPVTGRFGSSKVRLIPAAPGSGVIAGGTVRAVLEMAGYNDCLTKAYGSTNEKNLCKAVMDGLTQLRTRDVIAALRGIELDKTEVDEKLDASRRFMREQKEEGDKGERKKAAAPVNVVGQDRGGKRGGGRRGGGGGGRGRGPRGGGDQQQAPQGEQATATAEAPSGGGEGGGSEGSSNE
jgi:small subunit ribosomal protein S5